MLKRLVGLCLVLHLGSVAAVQLNSQHAIVVEDGTGKVLLEKNATEVAPIASLTKLMTAMVILDGKPNMDEMISIETADLDTIKHSMSHVPVGSTLSRRDVLQLALMSSDNRAAAALARTYPGGIVAFEKAVNVKIKALGMNNTAMKEPTGLSPENTSTAADLVKMAVAASHYPQITRPTPQTRSNSKVANAFSIIPIVWLAERGGTFYCLKPDLRMKQAIA